MLKRLSIVAVGVVLASDPVAALNLRANQKATGLFFADTKEATQAAHDASVTKLNDAIGSLKSDYEALDTERDAFQNTMQTERANLDIARATFATESEAKQATWSTKMQDMRQTMTDEAKSFQEEEGKLNQAFQQEQEFTQKEERKKLEDKMQASAEASMNAFQSEYGK